VNTTHSSESKTPPRESEQGPKGPAERNSQNTAARKRARAEGPGGAQLTKHRRAKASKGRMARHSGKTSRRMARRSGKTSRRMARRSGTHKTPPRESEQGPDGPAERKNESPDGPAQRKNESPDGPAQRNSQNTAARKRARAGWPGTAEKRVAGWPGGAQLTKHRRAKASKGRMARRSGKTNTASALQSPHLGSKSRAR